MTPDLREAVLCNGAGGTGQAEGVVGRGRPVYWKELAGLHQEEVTTELPQGGGHPAQELCTDTG